MQEKWTEFLTERDKKHLAISGLKPGQVFGLGERPAVLVVDAYYAALGVKREDLLESVKTWPMSCGLEGWEAIDRTAELLAVARQLKTPVIFVRAMAGFPSPWGQRTRSREWLGQLPSHERARAYEIVDELSPQPGELVLQKSAPSAFHGTPLLFHLNYLGVDTLIVCGETTSGCVRATVVDGATYRYRMAVVAECCFDRTEASHWINLFDMDSKYADVMDIDSAMQYMKASA